MDLTPVEWAQVKKVSDSLYKELQEFCVANKVQTKMVDAIILSIVLKWATSPKGGGIDNFVQLLHISKQQLVSGENN